MKEGFIESGSVKLHFIDWGGVGRPLVLLAGLGNAAQIYRGLAPKLAAHFRVVGLTRRGHGRSDKPDSGYDLDTLVDDIGCFMDALEIKRAILIGHSAAGIEMPRLAIRFPHRVEAIVFLDALFPVLDPEPDLSGDPIWSVPPPDPAADDLVSMDAFLAYHKRVRPDYARFWCEAIEADFLDKSIIKDDGRVEYLHDDGLMNRIVEEVWSVRDPKFEQVEAPMLAIVPDGDTHPGLPPDASDELRRSANQYWVEKSLPWIRQRSEVFRQAAPTASVVELDAPDHRIFIAREEETVKAIEQFLIE